jgi:hypothetical protein
MEMRCPQVNEIPTISQFEVGCSRGCELLSSWKSHSNILVPSVF